MKTTVQNEANIAMASPVAAANSAQVNQNNTAAAYVTNVSDAPRPRIVARRAARWARRASMS